MLLAAAEPEDEPGAEGESEGEREEGLLSPALLAMLEELSPFALAELERALRLQLRPAQLPTLQGYAEALGLLSELVREEQLLTFQDGTAKRPGVRSGVQSYPQRQEYDRRRSSADPSAATLVKRFGSWQKACRAAERVIFEDDLRAALPSPLRGKQGSPIYTREEVSAALRQCALELGLRPTANHYEQWSRRQRMLDRQGSTPRSEGFPRSRIPFISTIYRLYPKGKNRWRQALDDALISDEEIREARRKKFGLAGATAATTATAVSNGGRSSGGTDEILRLSLSEAIVEAQARGCSLEHLAGKTIKKGSPPAATEGDGEVRFDGAKVVELRRKRGIPEARVREALGLALGPYRRLLNGRDEPTLGQVVRLAELLGVGLGNLVRV